MAKSSDYLKEKIIDHVFRNTSYTPPATLYVALYKSDPTAADVGLEVDNAEYARQEITFTEPVDGVCTNSADIVFPMAVASWGIITHQGIRDADTGGNLLVYSSFSVARTVNGGDQFKILAGNLSITVS